MKHELRRKAVADFLRSRRLRLNPTDIGLTVGQRRKLQGLRREEVAQAAHISTTYYTWLEQGRDLNISDEVLHSLADALHLSSEERVYLSGLLQSPNSKSQTYGSGSIPFPLQLLLESQKVNPVYVLGIRCDILAWNQATCNVFGDFSELEPSKRNMVRYIFTNEAFRQRLQNWTAFAREATEVLRTTSAGHIEDDQLNELVQELSQTSSEFRAWWSEHGVRATPMTTWQIYHPLVGSFTLEAVILHPMCASDLKVCLYLPPSDDVDSTQKLYRLNKAER